MPLLAPLDTQLMIRLTQIALLLVAALAFSGANALPVSSERQSSISALGYALAPLIRNGDRPAIEKAISALESDTLQIAVIFDEDLTPIAYAGMSSALQGMDEGEALADPISLWAAELDAIGAETFQLAGSDVLAIATPIMLADQKLASLLIIEQPSAIIATPEKERGAQLSFVAGSSLAALVFLVFYLLAIRSNLRIKKRLLELAKNCPWTQPAKTNNRISNTTHIVDQLADKIASISKLNGAQSRLHLALANADSTEASEYALKNKILEETETLFSGAALFLAADGLMFTAKNRNEIDLAGNQYSLLELKKALEACKEPSEHSEHIVIELGGAHYSLQSLPVDGECINASQLLLIAGQSFDEHAQALFDEYGECLQLILALYKSRKILTDKLTDSERKLANEHTLRIDTQDRCERLRALSQKGYAFIGVDSRFLEDASRSFGRIFSCESVTGKTLQEVLFSRCQLPHEQIRQAIATIDLLLDSDALMFEFNKNKLPHRLTLINENGTRDELALHWHAIALDNKVNQLYLEVSSVAREVALEAQVKALQQEVELVGQVLKAPADAFGQFILAATEVFDVIGSMLKGSTTVITQEQALNIYQDIHKLKRESRRLGLVQVTEALYQLELLVDTSHRAESEYANCIEVLSAVQEVKHALQRYQHVDENILMRGESADQKGLSIKQVHAIRSQINALQGPVSALDKQKIDQISSLLTKASYTTLSHVLNYIGSHCEDIAINLGKAPPVMHLDSQELWLADEAVKAVKDNLMQLVSHIICHSIETILDRAKANKPPAGQIYVTFAARDSFIEIACKNDGKGISQERLARYQMDMGDMDDGASIDALEILSPAAKSQLSGTKKGNETLPFTIQFIADESGFHSYEGLLKVPLALCWHDADAKPIANVG